jgi:hypothetical protein
MSVGARSGRLLAQSESRRLRRPVDRTDQVSLDAPAHLSHRPVDHTGPGPEELPVVVPPRSRVPGNGVMSDIVCEETCRVQQ